MLFMKKENYFFLKRKRSNHIKNTKKSKSPKRESMTGLKYRYRRYGTKTATNNAADPFIK